MAQKTEQDYKNAYKLYRSKGQLDKARKTYEEYQQFLANQQTTVTPEAQPVEYQAMESLKNFPSSLGNAFGDVYTAVTNPIDTITSLGTLARSGLANAGQMLQDSLPTPVVSGMNRLENLVTGRDLPVGEDAKSYRLPNQEAGEDFVGFLDDRYGSLDAVKTTAMEDPAGMLLDFSGLLTGGGSTAAKIGGTVGKVGEKVADVGAKLDPITGVVRAPVAVVESHTGKPLSNMLYESAMKPSTNLTPDQRSKLIEDGLEFRAKPTAKSVDKLEAQRQQVLKEIEAIEDSAKLYGELADPQDLFKYVDDVRAEYAPPILTSVKARKAIDDVVEQQLEALFLHGGQDLTVADLARIKRKIYEEVSYDKLLKNSKIDAPSEKTMKVIAKAAKEAIEDVLPSIKAYNKLYGDIEDVQKNLQMPAANRIGNRDMMGIGAPLKTGVGATVGGDMGTVVGTSLGVLDMPVPKANLALAIKDTGEILRDPRVQKGVVASTLAGRYENAVLADKVEREREKLKRELNRSDR